MQQDLPIWELHGAIVGTLQSDHRLVLAAPTGSGKSTQVPQMLLEAWPDAPGRIVVLQPRRVAARSLAARVAWERHGQLGQEVGYQIRFDDQLSDQTQICYVTEGILLRWLQDNPRLNGIRAVLFDEFHERNLLSDVALALVKHLQSSRRPDLDLVVMSATLEAEPVARYLSCSILHCASRMFPVQTHYLDHADRRPMPELAAASVERIVRSGQPGDVLIFMPGMGEIQATLEALRGISSPEPLALLALHGDLPPETQDLAFAPQGRRKIVVATNVAETSITIDGICFVVDSGQARVARFDADRGLGTLHIEAISRASADQRQGRAGRTAPGQCFRLWTESGQLNRPERNTPEIQRTDLTEVVLLLHALGINQAGKFDWLDKPDSAAVERAERLLHWLGALEEPSGPLTEMGHLMRRLPMHPRFARMLLEASRRHCVRAAALCAALVSGRDLLLHLGRGDDHVAEARQQFEFNPASDFFTLIRAFRFAQDHHFQLESCRRVGIHAQTARQVEQTYEQILQIAKQQKLLQPEDRPDDISLQQCIMAGFIDQLCRRRDQGTLECDVTEGRQGTLARESVVRDAPLFVAASMREIPGRGGKNLTLLTLASAVHRPWIDELFPQHLVTTSEHLFDRTHKRVAAVRRLHFAGLLLQQDYLRETDPDASGLCLAQAHRQGLFELPLFNHEIKQWIARVNSVAAAAPALDFPPFDEPAIVRCLGTAFRGCTLVKEAQAIALKDSFWKHLARGQHEWLDELAPLSLVWTDGRHLKLLYSDATLDKPGPPPPPELQVKLHECFPLTEHPKICENRIPVKLWLCAPNGKRLESTLDWPAFKTSVYPRLRKNLLQQFPGVAWH